MAQNASKLLILRQSTLGLPRKKPVVLLSSAKERTQERATRAFDLVKLTTHIFLFGFSIFN
jgi:hypothetical protein